MGRRGGGGGEVIIAPIIIEESQGVAVLMVLQPPIICISDVYLCQERSWGLFGFSSGLRSNAAFLLQDWDKPVGHLNLGL